MLVEDLLIRVRADTAAATSALTGLTSGVGLLGIAAGVAAAGAFVKMGIDAQTELSRVQGLAGVSASQMQYYSSALEGMGARIGSTMAESAKGLYFVVSAGFAGADALNVLNYAEMAAHASGANLADVAHGVAGALNAYGAGADQAGKYTDIMTGAVTHGMQTYQQFASEMGTATATAAAHKVSLIELSAAEASLTTKGLDASMAFTGLNFAMTKVMVGGKEMGDQVRAAGGHLNDAAFAGASFVDRLNMLAHSSGLTESEFIKLVGGTRSSKAALDLVNDSGAKYRQTLTLLQGSAGLTAAAFATHDATIEGAFHRVGAAISNAAYEFVKFVTPTVVPFLEKVGAAIVEVSTHIQQYAPLIGGVAVAATILLAAAVWNLAAAVIAATWPLLLIAAGIAAVVAVLIFAYQHWTGFRIVVDTVRDALGRFIAALGPAMSAIGGFVSGAIKWFGDLFNGLGTFIHTAIVVFQMGWALIQTIVQTAIAVLIGAFQNAYNHSYLFKAIVDIIMGAFTLARNFITSVWNGIVGFLSGAFNTIRSIATSAWNAFVSIILSAVGRASSAVHAVNNAITSTLGGIIGAVVAIGAQIVQGLIRGIQGMAGAVAGAVGRIAGMVKSGLQAALGIHSPSEVTMEMGAMLGQGLILGLYAQDVPGMVAKHLSAIGGAAVGGLNVGVSGSVSSASGGAISMSGSASNGGASGPQTVHIHNHLSIDGRELAGALGQPLVNEIRLRTGQHV